MICNCKLQIKMAGIYMLSHPYEENTFKLGCSINISERITSGCYTTMFLLDKLPKLIGTFSVDQYNTSADVRYLEQCIFSQLKQKRLSDKRELFKNITYGEVKNCIENLQLNSSEKLEEVKAEEKTEFQFEENRVELYDYQKNILKIMEDYYLENDRGKLILPCGYGKSYIILHLIKEKFNTSIICCPSRLLCIQTQELAEKICVGYSVYFNMLPEILPEKWILITTYQSCAKFKIVPDLFVIDEAHRTCVTSKLSDEDSMFRNLLNLKAKKHLFMTATEKVLMQNEDEEDGIWYSMDSKLYGATIYSSDFSDAIEKDIISDYKIVVINKCDPVEVIKSALHFIGFSNMLTYHHRLEDAKKLCDDLNKTGIVSFYIDGTMDDNETKEIFKEFEKNKGSVLCSCKTLQEGISLNYVDCVYFVDKKSSEIDIIQCIGRCLRKYKCKNMGNIIIPEDMIEESLLMNTLVKYDPRLKDKIGKRLLGLECEVEKFKQLTKKLEYKIYGRYDSIFNYKLQLCLEYELETGRDKIPRTTIYKGNNIGSWIKSQKRKINKSSISKFQYSKLLELKTIDRWLKEPKKEKSFKRTFNEWFDLCFDYETKYGQFGQDTEYEGKIGWWLTSQMKKIRHKLIGEERKEKLMTLKTTVAWLEKGDLDIWLNVALEYEKNNEYIHRGTHYKGKSIGSWINRINNDIGNGIIIGEDLEKLKQLRTVVRYIKRRKLNFDDWLDLCLKYGGENKYIVRRVKFEEENIGSWVKRQERKIFNLELTRNEITKLTKLKSIRDYIETLDEEDKQRIKNYIKPTVRIRTCRTN